VAVIDKYAFTRECIARSLQALSSDIEILPFPSSDEARQGHRKFDLILYYCHGDEVGEFDAASWQELVTLAPTIVLSSGSARDFILEMFKRGVRGFIPTQSTTLELAIRILHVIRAGGNFVPLGLLPLGATDLMSGTRQPSAVKFTTREKSVITLLKCGAQNKIIAYEMKLNESTVKVHIRNIMRKMKVRNRTEVVSRLLGAMREFELESEGVNGATLAAKIAGAGSCACEVTYTIAREPSQGKGRPPYPGLRASVRHKGMPISGGRDHMGMVCGTAGGDSLARP
jgi:DNA-binding NarL/FixJ family response regulator